MICPYFQQFLYWGTSEFIFVPYIVAMLSELKIVDSKYFIFIFHFLFFYFYFWGLRVRVNIILLFHCHKLSHICHTIMCYMEECKRFWKDNIIIVCLTYVDLNVKIVDGGLYFIFSFFIFILLFFSFSFLIFYF